MIDAQLDLTLVMDIGKSNVKLFLLDDCGAVVERHSCANSSTVSALGYAALDVQGLKAWMQSTLQASNHAQRCGHVIVSTHGAAFVALGDKGLAWEPLDYEFDPVVSDGPAHSADTAGIALRAARDDFRQTLSPDLPAGLNAARQLHWLQHTHPQAWHLTRTLLPYPQYWTWLLSGVACSEVSSLGCHTHLWSPVTAEFSKLAVSRGWDTLFAPMRSAWEVVGTVGATRGAAWGLPAACAVHVGVHDSNACLARYFDAESATDQSAEALTIVSSGTWTVLMAPGAQADALVAARDMLGNVDVTGRLTPTARFMGGREFAAIADGADPLAANLDSLQHLIASRTFALPSFAHQGGPFANREGHLVRDGQRLDGAPAALLSPAERATLAATYCAQVTAWLVDYLWADQKPATRLKVIVEGPLAHSPVYLHVVQALLPESTCSYSTDTLEGTARGAWLLSRWGRAIGPLACTRVPIIDVGGLRRYHDSWLAQVNVPVLA
jgi:sugar (pentulose or hexulose) kinase